MITGIASDIPKNLPFNFPSAKIQKYFNDEGQSYTISAYFVDPSTFCVKQNGYAPTGDRLVFKSKTFEQSIALNENQIASEWTQGKCFYTMGQHYWSDVIGPLDENTKSENFVPIFLQYNKGKLNGFGWALNADLPSTRYEHQTRPVLGGFFKNIPKFMYDKTQVGVLSTLHIYLDSTPQLNFC